MLNVGKNHLEIQNPLYSKI